MSNCWFFLSTSITTKAPYPMFKKINVQKDPHFFYIFYNTRDCWTTSGQNKKTSFFTFFNHFCKLKAPPWRWFIREIFAQI